tara:strand:- start:742 stop:1320 length:579 start_codon:yes stop_codon:yes gene_type:complete
VIALWGIVLGLVIGLARGGSFENLGTLRLRGLPLVFLALAIQILTFPTPWWSAPPLASAARAWHLISYALLLVFLILNRRLVPLWGIAAGALMNIIVIAANHGLMPTDPHALAASGNPAVAEALTATPGATSGNVIAMGPNTRLDFLGDWLYLPPWVPFGDSFSPGDLVLMLGVAWLLQHAMRVRGAGTPRG